MIQKYLNQFKDYYYSDNGAWIDVVGKGLWKVFWIIFGYWIGSTFVLAFTTTFIQDTLPKLCSQMQL